MAYLIMGYILLFAGAWQGIKAIRCVWQEKTNLKGAIAYGCLMANFVLFGRAFTTLAQKPDQAETAKHAILNLGLINVLVIVVVAIILRVRKRNAR